MLNFSDQIHKTVAPGFSHLQLNIYPNIWGRNACSLSQCLIFQWNYVVFRQERALSSIDRCCPCGELVCVATSIGEVRW